MSYDVEEDTVSTMDKFIIGVILGTVLGFGAGVWFGRDKSRLPEIRKHDVQEEISRYGVVIKDKAKEAGAAIADATADARITTAIKSKLANDIGASTLTSISVNTSEGVVTLSGTVDNESQITNAVDIAHGIEGVRKVFSTLQVKGAQK